MILQSDKSPCARETAGGSAPCIGKRKGEIYLYLARASKNVRLGIAPADFGQFVPFQSATPAQLQRILSNFALCARTRARQKSDTSDKAASEVSDFRRRQPPIQPRHHAKLTQFDLVDAKTAAPARSPTDQEFTSPDIAPPGWVLGC